MKINLTEEEMGTIIKCIDSAIMSYISHQRDARQSKKRMLEGILLNKLKERFCKAMIQEAENSKKKEGDKKENKSKIYISLEDIFKTLEKAGVNYEITLHMNEHKLITLGFSIKSSEDLELFYSFLVRLRDIFADFIADLKKKYEAKDTLKA